MRFSFFMKEIAIQQKEQAEHLKVKRTQDRINDALKNARKDKQALTRRKSEPVSYTHLTLPTTPYV